MSSVACRCATVGTPTVSSRTWKTRLVPTVARWSRHESDALFADRPAGGFPLLHGAVDDGREVLADLRVGGVVEVRERNARRPWRPAEAAAVQQDRAVPLGQREH